MPIDEEELQLLDDLPVGAKDDSFQHRLYADMLAAVFRSGKPGRCVGFFGKWGQGKSSVVRQLEEKLAGQTKVITFNAWKSSGDSIRRQLLLQVLTEIDPNKAKQFKKFAGIELLKGLLEDEDVRKRGKKRDATQKIAKNLLLWVRLAPLLVGSVLLLALGLFCVIASLIGSQDSGSYWLTFALGLLFPAGGFLALYVGKTVKMKYLGYLSLGEPISESHRIKYPEQFKQLFIDAVSDYCKTGKRILVVVDDLDRCDATTVAEALAAIRQFTPDEISLSGISPSDFHCQFLIPCDELQVVLALESTGHDAGPEGARFHDYQSEELLRKFFDVTIRMHEIYQDDFLDYASNLAEGIDLDPQEAREIVALVGPRDPRLVKQLLNALRLSHDRLERQRQSEALPPLDELADLQHTERLLVALRETVPRMYSRVVIDPSILEDRDSAAWKEIAAEPSISDDRDSVDRKGNKKAATEDEVASTQRMLAAAGRVSAATAEILIHSKLPKLLHGVVGAGSLWVSLRHYNQDRFDEVLSNLSPDKSSDVQRWLAQEARRISGSTSIGLRQLLTLFLSYPKSKPEEEFIIPCLEAALASGSHVQRALSDHPQLNRLALLFPEIKSGVVARIHKFVVEDFLTAKGNSDSELQFLLATCRAMPERPQDDFRKWLVEGLKTDKEDGAFVDRISRLFPENRSLCSGFAPEGAVAAAGKPQWKQVIGKDAETNHPRSDVVMTLLGDSPEHATQCLDAILSGDGQLARPRSFNSANAGIEAAWVSVGRLLDLASDDGVQKAFKNMQPWLTLDPAQGSKRVLAAIGKNVLRLADNQFDQLAQFIVSSLAQQPQEIWPVETVGKTPDSVELVDRWRKLAEVVFNRYAKHLISPPVLTPQAKAVLKKIEELQWPVAARAETLFVRKLQESSQLQQFRPWLDALAPLVRVGSDCAAIRTKILDLINRKGNKVDTALATGLALLWVKEIDVESATSVGKLFIGQQSTLNQYRDFWSSLHEKDGAGKVLDTMADALPEEIRTLKSYTGPLDMIVEDFDLLDGNHKRSFLDKTVLSLLSASDTSTRQLGITLAAQVPRTTAALRKQLMLLIKEGSLSAEQEQAVSKAVEKTLLRAKRKPAS